MAASLGLLKKGAIKEGWLEKAKQAKNGKDEMRGGWTKRYFYLMGPQLRYFKKAEEKESKTKAKGIIELKNAKVDPVDPDQAEKRPYCFKVQTSDYNYTYIQAPSEEERDWWIYHLRKQAKYDDPLSPYHMKLLDPNEAKKAKAKEDKEAKASAKSQAGKGGSSPESGGESVSAASILAANQAKKAKDAKFSSEEPPGVFVNDLAPSDESFVLTWGVGAYGQLGNGATDVHLGPQIAAALTKQKVRSIAAGRTHAAAVTVNGRIFVWGQGEEMQLGLGARVKQTNAPTLLSRIVRETFCMVACGDNHTLALNVAGDVYSWGDGSKGQLGHGDTNNQEYPVLVERISKSEKKCRFIAAACDNSAGIVNEYLCCWGANASGQLGVAEPDMRPKPTAITELPLKDDRIKMVSLGAEFAAVVMESGTLWTVGNNSHGQCGHSGKTDQHVIKQVTMASQTGAKCLQVSCGATHMIAIIRARDDKHSAYVFGEVDAKKQGKLGQASVLPAAIYAASSISHYHTLLPSEGGRFKIWGVGTNLFGQLGSGNVKEASTYVQSIIHDELQVVQIAVGVAYTVALFKGTPPEDTKKLVDGVVEIFSSPEDREKRIKKEAEEKAKAKAEDERKKKEAEEQARLEREEEEKKKQAKLAIQREHYGKIRPCSLKGCVSGRKDGQIHCELHYSNLDAPIDPEALPPLWQKHEKNGRFYYVNTATKKTQWKKPDFDVTLLEDM